MIFLTGCHNTIDPNAGKIKSIDTWGEEGCRMWVQFEKDYNGDADFFVMISKEQCGQYHAGDTLQIINKSFERRQLKGGAQ